MFTKLHLVASSACLLTLLSVTGCQDGGTDSNALGDNRRSNFPEPQVNPPAPQKDSSAPEKDPVEEFRAFAKTVVASAQEIVKDKRFGVPIGQFGKIPSHFEIGSDYSIDVRESDSLISPNVGEIKLKRRVVYDEMLGRKNVHEKWHPIVVECGYQNGQWKLNTNLFQRLLPNE